MSGKDIYEENKRLRAENDLLREQQENARLRREKAADDCAELAIRAVNAFIAGKASIVTTSGNDPETRIIYFQMPPDPPQ